MRLLLQAHACTQCSMYADLQQLLRKLMHFNTQSSPARAWGTQCAPSHTASLLPSLAPGPHRVASRVAAAPRCCRDEPSRPSSEAGGAAGSPDGSGSPVAKEEGLKAPQAYPIQVRGTGGPWVQQLRLRIRPTDERAIGGSS
jgi:hypothetical protein